MVTQWLLRHAYPWVSDQKGQHGLHTTTVYYRLSSINPGVEFTYLYLVLLILAAVTPLNCVCDSSYLTGRFATLVLSQPGKIAPGILEKSHPDQLDLRVKDQRGNIDDLVQNFDNALEITRSCVKQSTYALHETSPPTCHSILYLSG